MGRKIALKKIQPGTYKLAQSFTGRVITRDEDPETSVHGEEEYMDVQPFNKGTTITILWQNESSVRFEAKFKARPRKILKGRLPFKKNPVTIEVE